MAGPVPAVEAMHDTIGPVTSNDAATRHAAALTVCGHARSITDAWLLLDACGLLPGRSPVPPVPRPEAQVDLAPLIGAVAEGVKAGRRCRRCGYLASKCGGRCR